MQHLNKILSNWKGYNTIYKSYTAFLFLQQMHNCFSLHNRTVHKFLHSIKFVKATQGKTEAFEVISQWFSIIHILFQRPLSIVLSMNPHLKLSNPKIPY